MKEDAPSCLIGDDQCIHNPWDKYIVPAPFSSTGDSTSKDPTGHEKKRDRGIERFTWDQLIYQI